MRRGIMVAGVLTMAMVGAAGFRTMEPASTVLQTSDDALHDHMEAIKGEMRTLFRAAAKPETKVDALEAMSNMQKHFVEAKDLVPKSVETVAVSDRDAFALDYRRKMAEVLRELAEIELLVIDDKNEEAVNHIREKLVALRDAAHEKFQVDG